MIGKGKKRKSKRARAMLSAYSIIMILVIILGICSHIMPSAKYVAIPTEDEVSMLSDAMDIAEEGDVLNGLETAADAATTVVAGTVTKVVDGAVTEVAVEATSGTVTGTPGEDSAVSSDIESVYNPAFDNEAVDSGEYLLKADEVEDVISGEIAESYDTLEACEEVNGVDGCMVEAGSGVVGAELYQVLMSPFNGFADALDVCVFVMILGGFLKVVTKTKALENGIKILVQKLKGKEYLLILLLMFIFSILGTTYGFLEESVAFYVLLAATMFAAGLDPLVGVATILLGAGSGVLGSTINPFATGVALSAMKDAGIEYDQGMVILIAVVLWLTTLAISAFFVIRYAKKVQRDKGSTFLTLREQAIAEKKYSGFAKEANETFIKLTGKQKVTLILFTITFLVMVVGFVPWGEFGVTFFDSWTGWLTGASLGNWWFYESALWFLIMAIVISIINRFGEKGFVDTFVDGADDMIGVVFVIAVARGVSVLMAQTSMDTFIIVNATNALANLPEMAFVPLNYILHVFLSFLVPSSSGLATMSTPIVAPIAAGLGYSTNVAAMTIVAANGLVNLITPTCGAIMGGLALAKIDYPTWLRWAFKVVLVIAVVNIIVLCLFSI